MFTTDLLLFRFIQFDKIAIGVSDVDLRCAVESLLAEVRVVFLFQIRLHRVGIGDGERKMREVRVVVRHRKCAPGEQVQFLTRRDFEPGPNRFQMFRHFDFFQTEKLTVKLRALLNVLHRQRDVVVAGDGDLGGEGLKGEEEEEGVEDFHDVGKIVNEE